MNDIDTLKQLEDRLLSFPIEINDIYHVLRSLISYLRKERCEHLQASPGTHSGFQDSSCIDCSDCGECIP